MLNASAFYGFDSGQIIGGDLFVDKRPAQWGFQAGDGGAQGINQGSAHYHSTAALAASPDEAPINFFMLLGSTFVDWNGATDNFIRSLLAKPNYGVAAMWTYNTIWDLSPLDFGGTLGEALLETSKVLYARCRSTYILGDPSLRLFVTPPVTSVTANTNGGNVNLSWNASIAPNASYLVYRTVNTGYASITDFTKLTSNPISACSFSDTQYLPQTKIYLIRAVNTIAAGSGSFTNMSQGVYITVN